MAKYQLWLASDQGSLISLLDNWISIEYTKGWNSINSFEIWLDGLVSGDISDTSLAVLTNQSARGSLVRAREISADLLRPDRTIQVWRRPGGPEQRYGRAELLTSDLNSGRLRRALKLETVGFLRSWDIRATNSLTIQTALRGNDPNGLLGRRIVAYAAASTEAEKTIEADDMMKEMVRENLGSLATDTARDLSAFGFSVSADRSDAPSITKGFAWKDLYDELVRIADASRQLGTPLYFTVAATSPTTYQFLTSIDQPGQDRTVSGGNPLVFGLGWGNMSNAVYNVSHLGEENYIYSLGSGSESDRKVTEVSDEARIAVSVWNRVEGIASAREADDRTAVGNAKLAEKQPTIHFTADIHDTPDLPYAGIGGWDVGDKVTVSYLGLQFDCVIESVRVRVERSGRETVQARVEYWG